jgi:hypothetical protein
MKELKVRMMERMLGAELTEHLGYEPHGEPSGQQAKGGHFNLIATYEEVVKLWSGAGREPCQDVGHHTAAWTGWYGDASTGHIKKAKLRFKPHP